MKKCELLTHQDDMETAIKHINALSKLLRVAGGQQLISESHQNECLSLLCDLVEEVQEINFTVSQGLSELYIIDNAVHGDSD